MSLEARPWNQTKAIKLFIAFASSLRHLAVAALMEVRAGNRNR
jgi:hypothetical protein